MNHPTMKLEVNRRGTEESFVESRHLKLIDLEEAAEAFGLENQYLFTNWHIPEYPRPEFHATYLKHDTDRDGLRGIRGDGGFGSPNESGFVWWSLVVGRNELMSAERRLLESAFPDWTEEQARRQQSFLGAFATSPAFQAASRLGSYRFTLPAAEMLEAYSDQFCSGAEPVMRVFKTVLYKQEVMYVVLVHSPYNSEEFSRHPLLTDDPNAICAYRDGFFIWRPEAMCETHHYRFSCDERGMTAEKVPGNPSFYVWDNVALALDVGQQVLQFPPNRLRETLRFCDRAKIICAPDLKFEDFPEAKSEVDKLWPDDSQPQEKAC